MIPYGLCSTANYSKSLRQACIARRSSTYRSFAQQHMPYLRACDFNQISHMRHRVVILTCATAFDLRDSKPLQYGGVKLYLVSHQVS